VHVLLYADRPAGTGGIETHVATLAKELCELGVDVTIGFRRVGRAGPFEVAVARGARLVELTKAEIAAFALRERVDVFHAHSAGAAAWGAREGKAIGLKHVVTLHGPGQSLVSAEGVDRVVAVSDEAAGPFRHLAERLAVIENGVDLERFAPGPARPRRAGEPLRAVYLGRVGPAKKPGILALERAAGCRTDVFVRYVSDWAPQGRPELTDDPARILKEADVVFSTGRGIREAMACGAAACVLGIHWDGLVTPENLDRLRRYNFSGRATRRPPSAAEISRTMHSLASDRRLLAGLKEFGPVAAARLWDAKTQARRTLAVYREVMGGTS